MIRENSQRYRKKYTKAIVNLSSFGASSCPLYIRLQSRVWFLLNSYVHGPYLFILLYLINHNDNREGDLKAAEAMLISTLKWRREFKVDELKTEDFPQDVYGKVGVISGKDKDGRPVTYNFYGAVDPNIVFKDVDQFIR